MKRSKRAPQKLEPILRELGFRIKEVYADCLDLMVDGVRELSLIHICPVARTTCPFFHRQE